MSTYDICILIFIFAAMALGGLVLGLGTFIPEARPRAAAQSVEPDIQIWALD